VLVHGIVLAAGASTRMGSPKMLLPVGAGTLLAAALRPLLDAGLPRVVVVLGHEAEAIRRGAGLPGDPRLEVVVNAAWPTGLASSLRAGLAACGGADAVLVALGDQPGVSATVVARLLEAAAAPLAVPVHAGRIGHPILFGRALWPELLALSGDAGARTVVMRHLAEAALVAGELLRDLDSEADYRAYLAGEPPRADEGLELPKL
jgi:CTP:molybdopterin cytidylyltransferase MocA